MAKSISAPAARSLCVFCGSSMGRGDEYRQAAARAGRLLAQRGVRLIYGGGGLGLMGAMAESAIQSGGDVVGVMPRFLREREAAHAGLGGLHLVDTMQQRKDLMCELSDAFLVLPGGFGTLDECFEVLTGNQLGLLDKPIGLFNQLGFYDSLLDFLRNAVAAELLPPDALSLLHVGDRLDLLIDHLLAASRSR